MVVDAEVKKEQGRPLFGVNGEVLLKKYLTGPTLLSRWEKRGRGGTEDETVKPLDGVQRV